MAVNDITMFEPGAYSVVGTKKYYVAGNVTTINPGEPVGMKALGASYVIPLANGTPLSGTDYMVGIAASTATNNTTAGQLVDVFPLVKGAMYLISPNVAATYGLGATPNQTTYNNLIGSRVTFNLTTGTYTLNSSDSAANGLVVEYTDVTKAGGKVTFSVRDHATYLGQTASSG